MSISYEETVHFIYKIKKHKIIHIGEGEQFIIYKHREILIGRKQFSQIKKHRKVLIRRKQFSQTKEQMARNSHLHLEWDVTWLTSHWFLTANGHIACSHYHSMSLEMFGKFIFVLKYFASYLLLLLIHSNWWNELMKQISPSPSWISTTTTTLLLVVLVM